MTAPRHLRVDVDRAPDPYLLRAAIAARLAGRPWTGPEAAIADRVVATVEGAGAEPGAEPAAAQREAGAWR